MKVRFTTTFRTSLILSQPISAAVNFHGTIITLSLSRYHIIIVGSIVDIPGHRMKTSSEFC